MTARETTHRILLIQIRDEPSVRQEEVDSFLRYGGLDPGELVVWNVFDRPDFGPSIVDGFDAVFVGGASEASAMEPERYPFVRNIVTLQRYCLEQKIPHFASCFGFQTAVLAFGGRLQRDERDFEMGTLPISLREAAAEDTLFHDVPEGFLAVSCHRERSLTAPPGTVELAYTEACCHVFRAKESPFWAFQFHPELDRACFEARLRIFQAKYSDDPESLEHVFSTFQETPLSNDLVKKFVDRVLSSPA